MRVREERTPTVSGSTQNLAKLMATENITVTFEKVSTAAFDLKSRKLILPIWKNISEATYNFLVAHEVSHALNTPVEEWEKSATNKNIAQTIVKPIINLFIFNLFDKAIEELTSS